MCRLKTNYLLSQRKDSVCLELMNRQNNENKVRALAMLECGVNKNDVVLRLLEVNSTIFTSKTM